MYLTDTNTFQPCIHTLDTILYIPLFIFPHFVVNLPTVYHAAIGTLQSCVHMLKNAVYSFTYLPIFCRCPQYPYRHRHSPTVCPHASYCFLFALFPHFVVTVYHTIKGTFQPLKPSLCTFSLYETCKNSTLISMPVAVTCIKTMELSLY
jgi:hypothetical protein